MTVHSSSRARYGTGDVQVVPAPRLHVTRQHESACQVNRDPGASAARAHAPAGGAWPGRGLTPAVPRREDRWRAAVWRSSGASTVTVHSSSRASTREDECTVTAFVCAVELGERDALLSRVLRLLLNEQREAIEMVFLRECSQGTAAEHLGVPLGTLKRRVRLGLRRMRVLLDQSGVTQSEH